MSLPKGQPYDPPTAVADQTQPTQPLALPEPEDQGVRLHYLEIPADLDNRIQTYPVQYPHLVHEMLCRALQQLGITVEKNQRPLTAWVLAMARANGLPEVTPQHDIGGATAEICPRWVWFLA